MRDDTRNVIQLSVRAPSHAAGFERQQEPVTVGVPIPRGCLHDEDACRLDDASGQAVALQTTVLDRWGDGTIRWLLLDFQAVVAPFASMRYALHLNVRRGRNDAGASLRVESQDRTVCVNTGRAIFRMSPGRGFVWSAVDVIGRGALDPDGSSLVAEDASGRRYGLHVREVAVLAAGPLRALVRVTGGLVDECGRAWLDVSADVHMFAGLASARIELSVTNRRRAAHPGGCWDLGAGGSVRLRELSMHLALPPGHITDTRCSPECSKPMVSMRMPFDLYQDSSGGEQWQSRAHLAATGRSACTFRGYELRATSGTETGLRAAPIVSQRIDRATLSVTVPRFWENFPKAVGVREGRVTVGLFPRQSAEPHELQGGEQKTHSIVVCFGDDTVSGVPLAWARSPLTAVVAAQDYARTRVWSPVSRGSSEARSAYERLIESVDLAAKREVIDEYGWRHFGDLYADHEAVAKPGLVSHYNNQYDVLAGMATRFAQTGDDRWRGLMDDLAAHVADIDIYHCTDDKPAYNNGLFWHTNHHCDAETSTHRSYSRRAGGAGGGPSAEHNYTTGLMLHYFMTGCLRSRDAVLQLAGWVLAMDDGARSAWRWIDRGPTGLASATREPGFHGPGRGGGNSINALLDAYRLSGDAKYLDGAETLIRRCIHPHDDPDAAELLDAERRWSYTVFLQALGKYLDLKIERGDTGGRYGYARAALLRYAEWMAVNERPYLDRAEQLEFPTETWAAQDIRKAAVFEYAARYAMSDVQHARFVAGADRFFDYSATALASMPTRTFTRPLALMLAYGFQRPLDDRRVMWMADEDEPAWVDEQPVPFVPYRKRVLTRLAVAAAVVLLSLGALTAWALNARSLDVKHVNERAVRVAVGVGP